jgi:signal transduction histidine kinase
MSVRAFIYKGLYTSVYHILLIGILLISVEHLKAQDTQVIQIKAFNESLTPYGNIKISINQGKYVELNDKGLAFANLKKDELPIKSVEVGDPTLEAASWNLSKGILELTIRKKSYRDVKLLLKDENNDVVAGAKLTYIGEKTVNIVTNTNGIATVPLALNERIIETNQFNVEGFIPQNVSYQNDQYVLRVERLKQQVTIIDKDTPSLDVIDKSASDPNWEIFISNKIDSIDDLTLFYTLLKDAKIEELSESTRQKLDDKFQSLLAEISQSNDSTSFITYITDTTIVERDLENLLKEVRREGNRLNAQKSTFTNKIELVKEKLSNGIANLSKQERASLLDDINQLEQLLLANENEFYENLSGYKEMINELKVKYFNLTELEDKLSASEQKRLDEKKRFQQRILFISAITIFFALLIILLIYLWGRLKKQQRQLVVANEKVNNINQNLETIVSERTNLLEQTFKELDMVLYRASHDLRAPICSIAGLSDLISRDTKNDQLTNLILKTNSQMDKLLKKLSTISEIHQPGKFKKVNIYNLAKEVSERFSSIIEAGNLTFELDCNKELTVVTIPYLVEVIISNLLDNAFFFSSIKHSNIRKVQLKISQEADKLCIEVKDNGIGVDDKLSNKLFDMFYVGTEYSKGNGLGLYIVRKSVDVLKGQISLESEPYKYTKVKVELPVDDSQGHALDFLIDVKRV